jgi:hypothetical protein
MRQSELVSRDFQRAVKYAEDLYSALFGKHVGDTVMPVKQDRNIAR